MAIIHTEPRQVRITGCSIYSPGLEKRVKNGEQGVDVSSFLQQVDIYESIFDNTISGSIVLLENIGLIELIPIIGVEYLWFSFETEDDKGEVRKFARQFRVVKVRDVSYPRHDYRLFSLDLLTQEFVASISQRISRQYEKKTVKEAVQDILKKDLLVDKPKMLEDTNGKITVTIPNYTPLQAINFLSLLGQTKDKKESNFVFFETLEGFHFTSISKLIKDGKKAAGNITFMIDPGNITGVDKSDDETVRNGVSRIYQEQTADVLVDIAGGMLRSQMIHFDFLARKIEHTEDSRYTETFKKTEHLGEEPVYPPNFDHGLKKNVRTFTVPTNVWSVKGTWMKKTDPDTPEQRLHEAIVLHNRQMREITHIQTLIELPGHPDIHAGSVMNIQYPSTRPMQDATLSITDSFPQKETPLFTGPHLVTSVRHKMSPVGGGQFDYQMHLKVCSDSHRTKALSFAEGELYE
jgi:hypothetical protein